MEDSLGTDEIKKTAKEIDRQGNSSLNNRKDGRQFGHRRDKKTAKEIDRQGNSSLNNRKDGRQFGNRRDKKRQLKKLVDRKIDH